MIVATFPGVNTEWSDTGDKQRLIICLTPVNAVVCPRNPTANPTAASVVSQDSVLCYAFVRRWTLFLEFIPNCLTTFPDHRGDRLGDRVFNSRRV